MPKKIITYLFFYSKILIPTLCLAVSMGFVFGLSFKIIILSYVLFSLMFHYVIYERIYPNEYYFYYNLGLSKIFLWSITLGINSVLTIMFLT